MHLPLVVRRRIAVALRPLVAPVIALVIAFAAGAPSVLAQPIRPNPGDGNAGGGNAGGGNAGAGNAGGGNAGGGLAGGGAVGGGLINIGGGGNLGGGIITIGGGGGIGIINIGGLGGFGSGTSTESAIVVPRGALSGEPVSATALLTTPPIAALGGTQAATTPSATYQWSISGGRIISDPRASTIQFIADGAGTVGLSVAIGANGTSYNPTAQVTVLAPETAGSITAPASVASSAPTVTASVPAARSGDRTFRWTVSGDATIMAGQGTANVTVRPGTPGLKELTCNVNLQNLVAVPVRAYLVVTGTGTPRIVTVNGGSGGGTYPAGSRVDIFADPPAVGQVFDRWVGDTQVLGAGAILPSLAHTVITVPDAPAMLTATYKAGAMAPRTTIENFNPQTPSGTTNASAAIATTLTYSIPPSATGVVFLLHDSGGSLADWFNRPEQLLLVRDLAGAGYGVAALNSTNRTQGTWAAQTTLVSNVDAQNHLAALDRLLRDGQIGATTPVFFLGERAGAEAALRIADLLATATPARPVKGAVLYLSPGNESLAVTSRVPQLFALAANDETLGATGVADARENSQLLTGRGVPTNFITNPVSPVHAGRFRSLGLTSDKFTADDAQAVWQAVKKAEVLDANNYVKTIPPTAALTAALPAAYRSQVEAVAAQLTVALAGREFYSDANARVINFFNARTADAAAPAPGRVVNISTRAEVAYLGDTVSLGFTLSGTQPATLLIRGIGPGLARFGVSTALPAARLQVNRGTTTIAANEGWDKAGGTSTPAQLRTAATSVSAFALGAGDLDTAVLVQLEPGSYTATIQGVNGCVGDVLVEIYDISRNATRITNLSILGRINSEGDLLIPGIVIAGNNPRTVVVRAVAQGLADFGLTSDTLLGDPRISILSGNQTLATNNNWGQNAPATLSAVFPMIGAFPLRAASDAAVVSALPPGSYTLQAGATPLAVVPAGTLLPVNFVPPNATGAVLVEMYEVP